MHDLTTIAKLNSQTAEAHAIKSRDASKYGLAKFNGMNFHSWSDFDSEASRNAASLEWCNQGPENTVKMFSPKSQAA